MQNIQNVVSAFLPFVVLILIFYFFIIRPQRNQQKKHKEMIDSLTKGDKIVTTGGFICEVVKAEEKFFTVKLSDDTTARVVKEYIAYKMDDNN
ncbi:MULTISPECIES: preprotein translocase subunit YajC [unclassified Helicobacter]|uniref:preprotein translocase subunit YajC n=1 Tax=unclassified Helicobacter TaxID=2593540 RepID=UPI000CF09A1F|nr:MULTISPECIES: preprotein translocase subunit YajC [unclassified Helicobacter]